MRAMYVVCLAVLMAGCATGPDTAVRPMSLNSDFVVYFEQSDRVPKDVLMMPDKKVATTETVSGIPVDIIGEVVKEVVSFLPEMSNGYSNERMNNAIIGRRILFIGYETPEQLEKIRDIVESMGKIVEPIAIQNK